MVLLGGLESWRQPIFLVSWGCSRKFILPCREEGSIPFKLLYARRKFWRLMWSLILRILDDLKRGVAEVRGG